MHISRVVSNLKGGVDQELGPRTVIIGPNASGKSAITDAVELALTGSLSELGGKAVGKEAELLTLAPPGEDLRAEVTFADGTESRCLIGRGAKDGHARKAQLSGAARGALAVREVLDALGGGPQPARNWLLGRSVFTEAEFRKLLPALLIPATTRLDTPEAVLGLIEREKKLGREAAARAKAAAQILAKTTPAAVELDNGPDVKVLEASVRACREHVRLARLLPLQESLEALTLPLAEAAEVVEAAKWRVHELAADAPKDLSPEQVGAIAVVRHAKSQGCAGECLACGGQPSVEAWTARVAAVEKALGRREAKRAVLYEAREAHLHAQTELAALVNKQGVLRTSRGTEVLPSHLPDLESAELRFAVAVKRLEEAKRSEMRGEEQAKLLKTAWADQATAQTEATEHVALAEALQRAANLLLARTVAGLVRQVQDYLPGDDVFGLELFDGDREVCRWGLRQGTVLRTALSGAEWARVTAAMALGLGDGSVVIFPDRALDPDTLTQVLVALSVEEGTKQVLLTTPIEPSEIPAGWTVIRTGDKE